jgi:hypothetical protein
MQDRDCLHVRAGAFSKVGQPLMVAILVKSK